MCASRPLPGSNWFEQARGREAPHFFRIGMGRSTLYICIPGFSLVLELLLLCSGTCLKKASFPFSLPPIVVSSLLHVLLGQIVTQGWQFGFIGWVCVMSSHEYRTIWVNPNPIYLINWVKSLNS